MRWRGALAVAVGLAWITVAAKGVGLAAQAVGLFLLLASLAPDRWLDRGVRGAAKARDLLGQIVTGLLLAPVFYLILTPYGLLTRRGAKDPLRRRFDASLPSYWTVRRSGPSRRTRPF